MSDTITEEVQASFAGAGDRRFCDVMQALVRHAHAFIREVYVTPQEWDAAIAFLTKAGQICTNERQEFVLLSDTLGISTLVENINYAVTEEVTENSVLGPFFVEAAPALPSGTDISGPQQGEPLIIRGRVRGPDGTGLAGATVDVWQSDAHGFYDVQLPRRAGYHLRGRFSTDQDGRFWLRSIRPAKYPIPHDGPVGRMLAAAGRHPYRPAHIHFKIKADGFAPIITQIFDADSEYLANDAVFGVKQSLVRRYARDATEVSTPGSAETPYLLEHEFVLMPIPGARATCDAQPGAQP